MVTHNSETTDDTSTGRSIPEADANDGESLHHLFATHGAARERGADGAKPSQAGPRSGQYPRVETRDNEGGPQTSRVIARWLAVTIVVAAVTAFGLGIGTIRLGGDVTTFAAGLLIGLSGLVLGFVELERRR